MLTTVKVTITQRGGVLVPAQECANISITCSSEIEAVSRVIAMMLVAEESNINALITRVREIYQAISSSRDIASNEASEK